MHLSRPRSEWVVAGVAGSEDWKGVDWQPEVSKDGVERVGLVGVGDDSTSCTAETGENVVEVHPADEGGPVDTAGAWRQESLAEPRSRSLVRGALFAEPRSISRAAELVQY